MVHKKIIFFTVLFTVLSFSQDKKKSKGDVYFFEYSYDAAIQQYLKEQKGGALSNEQYLNLADSYFKVGNYEQAFTTFSEVLERDSTMSTHHFNKMLQSMAKTSKKEQLNSFLDAHKQVFAGELVENAEFNFELLKNGEDAQMNVDLFNSDGNSPQSDFAPAFYKDKLLFSSARPRKSKKDYGPSGESYLDIYASKFMPDGNIFKDPYHLEGIPDSKYHKGTPYYSNTLDKLFYIVSNEEDGELQFDDKGKNSLAIGLAKVSTGPNKSFNYLLRDLSTSFYYPFYEATTNKLYFAANFEDGYGGTDIYFVYTNQGQIMSAPVNLGPRINSPGNEIAPFVFENSLYFSSDVFYGMGGMDIYKTNMQTDGSFSIPINLGNAINSPKDDFGFIIRNEGEGLLGYFSSNRAGGRGNDDIYGFKVAEKPGLKTIALKGRVLKPDLRTLVSNALVQVLDAEGNLLKEVSSNMEGKYQLEIPWKDNITLTVNKEKYSSFSRNFKDEDTLVQVQSKPLDIPLTYLEDIIEEKENQAVIKLNKFYFDRGKSDITPDMEKELSKVVEAVRKFPELQLRIESHTDSRGGGSANFRLSQKRSDTLKEYLIANGVPSSNILYAVGYGEDKILNNCKNGVYCIDLLHRKNERSLIVVLNYNLLK